MTSLSRTFAALLAGLAVLVGGIWLGGHPEALPDPLRGSLVDDDRALRAEIEDAILDDFYEQVDEADLEQGSLKGMVQGLADDFSSYLTPRETREFEQSVSGRFEGVGMNVEQDRRGLRVLTVFDDSPAEEAGIEDGDLVVGVNGRSIAGLSSQVATARIKGPAGTPVKLQVVDPDSLEARDVEVERAEIDIPVASGEVVERDGVKVGVVSLATFSEGAHGLVRKEIDALLDQGAEALVLDLRGNGGGLLQEGVLVASIFVEDGLIVSTDGRSRPKREFEAVGDAIDADIPIVVLVDRGTASASEIVTGALKERDRGTVVGTRTYGKGVFQEVQPLSNGGLLDITVGEYFLPNGESIGESGIEPDVRAQDDPDTDRDEARPVAIRTLVDAASGS